MKSISHRLVLRGFLAFAAVLAVGQPSLVLANGPGDYNGDRHIDLLDYDWLLSCITGPGFGFVSPDCRVFDFDGDDDVDFIDFGAFQLAFTGEQVKRVPTVSQWGMTILVLSLLSGVTVKFGRRRVLPAGNGCVRVRSVER